MDVTNTPQVTRYVPPTISRRPLDRTQPDLEKGKEDGRSDEKDKIVQEDGPMVSANPLARLFESGHKPVQAGRRMVPSAEQEATLGRFLDVIA